MNARRPAGPRAIRFLTLVCLVLICWTCPAAWARDQTGSTAAELSRPQTWGEAPEAPNDTTSANGQRPTLGRPQVPERRVGESETLDRMFPVGTPTPDPSAQGREIQELIHMLGTESAQSQKAVERLVTIGEPAVPALVGALHGEYKFTRVGALRVLGYLRDARAVPEISACLKDPTSEVRAEAVKTLGLMRAAGSVPLLRAHLSDPSVRVRREIATALARLPGPAARTGLLAALTDAAAEVRQQAAQEASAFPDAGMVQALLAATHDADPKTCGFAARALGEIGDPAARPRLEALSGSRDRFIRTEAAQALQNLP